MSQEDLDRKALVVRTVEYYHPAIAELTRWDRQIPEAVYGNPNLTEAMVADACFDVRDSYSDMTTQELQQHLDWIFVHLLDTLGPGE